MANTRLDQFSDVESLRAASLLSLQDLLLDFECVGTSRVKLHPDISDAALAAELMRRVEAGLIPVRPFGVVSTADGHVVTRCARMREAERECKSGQAVRVLASEE